MVDLDLDALGALGAKISPLTDGAGVEEVVAQGRLAVPGAEPVPMAVRFSARPGSGVTSTVEEPPTELLQPLDDYASKVVRSRRRGLVYPYELSRVLAGPGGSLIEPMVLITPSTAATMPNAGVPSASDWKAPTMRSRSW